MKTDYYLGVCEEGFHRIAYTEWGTPSSSHTPLICVHGLTRNRRDFDHLANYLSEREFHLFCPDIVGRGDSDWLNNPLHYTFEQYIADCNVMISRIHTQEIDWVGTSMGGIIGMALASLPNSPIRRLILNDVGPQIQLKGLTRLMLQVGSHPYFSTIEQAILYHKQTLPDLGNLTEAQWQEISENSIYETKPGIFTLKFDPKIKTTSLKSKMAWSSVLHPHKALEGVLFDVELWEIWETVKCPVLIIRGKKSDILSMSTVDRMKRGHIHVDVIEIPDAGHAPALLDPEQHEMIYQWLKKTY
ncbi:MAG: hydrolase [Gammaproteobacteria bacterium RIFCSPHIGHO2_12_FULL_37_14]|nr:MAG: hydrolase [Gammaproteobacteria bacterium RIFCSPHIGHO2_12_FULL_37_14]